MAECTGLENRQGKPSWVQIPRPPPEFINLWVISYPLRPLLTSASQVVRAKLAYVINRLR